MRLTVHYDNPREWSELLKTIETGVETFKQRPVPELVPQEEQYVPSPSRIDWLEWYVQATRMRP